MEIWPHKGINSNRNNKNIDKNILLFKKMINK